MERIVARLPAPATVAVTGDVVHLIGLDFGSTTSSAMVAVAGIAVSSATGRMAFGRPSILYRSEPVFTPFRGDGLDLDRIEELIDGWLAASEVSPKEIFAGGAIITGLAARRRYAAQLAALVERKIGEAVIATADDPALESWLAFMGAASALSRGLGERPVLNLDIGGGTTNPAIGVAGNVAATGCYFVGARHVQLAPGTLRVTGLSPFAQALLEHLGIERRAGDEFTEAELDTVVGFYARALEAIALDDPSFFATGVGRVHEQLPFRRPPGVGDPVVLFSGGVGELVYAHAAGTALPGRAYFGDLGVELAGAILRSEILSAHVRTFVPENRGRATVYGMTLHSTEVSGTTLFLRDRGLLPLRDLPVVAHLPSDAGEAAFGEALALARRSARGACIHVSHRPESRMTLDDVRGLGTSLARASAAVPPPDGLPIVLLLTENVGKAVGSYASDWGRSPLNLIVIDEIAVRDALFVNIGRDRNGIVPVSFYGIR
jgi:ethanolamine utilization protein EutA